MNVTPINQHTPGPLIAYPGEAFREFSHILIARGDRNTGALGHSPKESEAELGYTRYRPEDAALLAASYTMTDKAARTLGIDASQLARDTNLAALIAFRSAVLVGLDKLADSPISFMSHVKHCAEDAGQCAPDLR